MTDNGNKSFNMMEGLPEPPAKGIYFDNNATTPVAPEVLEKMIPLLTEHFGNPSSMHSFGARAGDEVAAVLGGNDRGQGRQYGKRLQGNSPSRVGAIFAASLRWPSGLGCSSSSRK